MEMLQGQFSKTLVDQLARQIGGASSKQTNSAIQLAIPAIMNALSRNVASPEGAEGLAGALERDHDGSIMDDVFGFLSGSKAATNPNMMNGSGILSHILGGNQNNVIGMVAKMTGLDQSKAGSLLVTLAPMILGVIGKQKKESQLGSTDLADLITRSTENHNRGFKKAGIINQVLDSDGDGSVLDDIGGMGLKFLMSRFFGKK